MANYPDYEGYAYSFARAELSLNRKIYTAISNVQFEQPTTEGVVRGTRPWPLARTEGEMDIGTGTITFSDEAERAAFLADLGEGYRTAVWDLNWVLTAQGRPAMRLSCKGCRVLNAAIDHGTGEEALGGDIAFSALAHFINGLAAHRGMVSPTR